MAVSISLDYGMVTVLLYKWMVNVYTCDIPVIWESHTLVRDESDYGEHFFLKENSIFLRKVGINY